MRCHELELEHAGPSCFTNTKRAIGTYYPTEGPSERWLLADPEGLGHDVRRHLLTVSSRHRTGGEGTRLHDSGYGNDSGYGDDRKLLFNVSVLRE